MSRLTLDQFKKETVKKEQDIKELKKLTGGILGACHTTAPAPSGNGTKELKELQQVIKDIQAQYPWVN
ncbi:hypothetical protein SAMN05880574_12634 [Chryseobacterium sp. RU37D]|uniref:hypothetical protein n=1 Tax=Chryseobacterium sp. RU37D TaxID=1907397 RepID=UPI000955580B|nr:hypothetical protein [Chryseobacterium sp. RU37D]SIQ80904.1 hypothetical protein SAMN05880574_12634 [Chryseobacterium sp. RU37D]